MDMLKANKTSIVVPFILLGCLPTLGRSIFYYKLMPLPLLGCLPNMGRSIFTDQAYDFTHSLNWSYFASAR